MMCVASWDRVMPLLLPYAYKQCDRDAILDLVGRIRR